jgi:leucyl/phenylalanyl-tRNA--protein transferase
MSAESHQTRLTWIQAQDPLPPVETAWGLASDAPGLLAAGADLGVERLLEAYQQGIFPWFNPDQPILWWSPDPRMVLKIQDFKLHRSLRKTLTRYAAHPGFEICFDRAFNQVIESCAQSPRDGQNGTWIVPAMVEAYKALHQAGYAHSVETWLDGELVAGLYFVCIGKAVFGESMFSTISDGSKMALAALVQICARHQIVAIDCQQNTAHLALMGAQEVPRSEFLTLINLAKQAISPDWKHVAIDWDDWRFAKTA